MTEINESMWTEKTEHYQELQALESQYRQSLQDAARYNGSNDSDFIHKDDIHWLLTKERGEAMLVMFFITTFFWSIIGTALYAFFA